MAKKKNGAPRSGAQKAKSSASAKKAASALKTTIQAAMAPTVMLASPQQNDQKTPVVNPAKGNARGFQGFVTGMSRAAARLVPRVNRKRPRRPAKARRPKVGKAVGMRPVAKVARKSAGRKRGGRGLLIALMIILLAVGGSYYYLSTSSGGAGVRDRSATKVVSPEGKAGKKATRVSSHGKGQAKKVVTSRGASMAVDQKKFSKLSLKEKRRIWRKKTKALQRQAQKKRAANVRRVRQDN